jgi:hypothetical protein
LHPTICALHATLVALQALAGTSAEARKECSSWQAQAQDSLHTISRLQQMLADAAAWGDPTTAPHGSAAAASAGALTQQQQQDADQQQQDGEQQQQEEEGVSQPAAGQGGPQEVEVLRGTVLSLQGQVTGLEVQVKVLSSQLLRSHAAFKQAGSSIAPLLSGVEARLLALQARTGGLIA